MSGPGKRSDAQPNNLDDRTEILFVDTPAADPRPEPPEKTELLALDEPHDKSRDKSREDDDDDHTAVFAVPAASPAAAPPAAPPPPQASANPGWLAARPPTQPQNAGPAGHFARIPPSGGISTTPAPLAAGGGWSFPGALAPGGQALIIHTTPSGSTTRASAGTIEGSSAGSALQRGQPPPSARSSNTPDGDLGGPPGDDTSPDNQTQRPRDDNSARDNNGSSNNLASGNGPSASPSSGAPPQFAPSSAAAGRASLAAGQQSLPSSSSIPGQLSQASTALSGRLSPSASSQGAPSSPLSQGAPSSASSHGAPPSASSHGAPSSASSQGASAYGSSPSATASSPSSSASPFGSSPNAQSTPSSAGTSASAGATRPLQAGDASASGSTNPWSSPQAPSSRATDSSSPGANQDAAQSSTGPVLFAPLPYAPSGAGTSSSGRPRPSDPHATQSQDRLPLLGAPRQPLSGKYRQVEAFLTQFEVKSDGSFDLHTHVELEKIRIARRTSRTDHDELTCRRDLMDRRIRQAYTVRQTRERDAGKRGRAVLSVFTAPEWSFNIPGKPLTAAQRDRLVEHLLDLGKPMSGMLIVPGTVVSTPNDHPGELQTEAFVFHDGLLIKRVLRSAREPAFGGESSLFEFEGLYLSLEICTDHRERRARSDAHRLDHGVDVQIVVADGTVILPRTLAAHAGGLVIHHDASPFGERARHLPGDRREVCRPEVYFHEHTWDVRTGDLEDHGHLLTTQPHGINRV